MVCSNCGTENRPGRKFCGGCAAPLALLCPSCGVANEPDMRFCGECATPLVAEATPSPSTTTRPGPPAAPASVAERRHLSVLFADLVGFTPFAEERDAEEVRDTLARYFDLAGEVIARHGGTVEKFIGDAVMAVWGAPVAHEDDAERAVRAALELVDAVRSLGPSIQVRAGVLTGEAAVTVGATGQGMVAGDLVNTAARLQSVAPPGAVLVGEATQRAAAAAIVFEPAGEQALRGKSAPVPAWRALRVVAERGGRNRSEALEAPFVGRADELRLLKDLFHATIRERRPRHVSVTGQAGIGKTRLAWEFLKYVDGLAADAFWHEGRCPAYGEGITFWALGEMVRARAGLLETDDGATTRAKIAETVAAHLPDPDERRWIEPALLALLGIEASAAGPEQLFGAWRTFFERLAAVAPVVLVFEDLHHADSGLLDFIDHLLEWSRSVPIYVLTLARPELLERRPDWGAGRRNFASLHLEALPESAMRELLGGLVPGLPEAAARAIVERADGVPLYAVETVRMLLADGKLVASDGTYQLAGDLATIAVPETLTELVAARLDALEPAERTLLLDAAVLGQSFTLAGLSAVSGVAEAELEPRLRALVRRELLAVEGNPRSPERGQYAFVQALVREVAYNTLARRDRKVRHLATARHFESLGTDELAGALASHFLAAYRNAAEGPEADALAAQARIALRGAADRAINLGSLGQAVAFLDQARDVTRDEAELAELLERAGSAASQAGLGEVAEDRLRKAVELRRALGDADAIAGAIARLGEALVTVLRSEAALAVLEPAAAELLGEEPEPASPDGPGVGAGGVALLGQLSRAYLFHEEHRRAIEVADRALAAGERLDQVAIVSDVLITRGTALGSLGRTYEGIGAIKAGLDLAEQHGLVSTALRGRVNLGVFQTESDPRAAFETAEAALEVAMRLGLRSAAGTLVENAAGAAIDVGEWERAVRELTVARDESLDELTHNLLSWHLVTFAAWRGDDVAAEVDRLTAWAESFDEKGAREAVHGLRAEVAFGAGDFLTACDEWMAFGPSNALNAPRTYFLGGLAALMAADPDRAAAALSAHERTGAHARLTAFDRRLLRAGLSALDDRRVEALREARVVIGEYGRLGLPWRQALGALMLLSTIGGADPDVRAAAERARETLARLEAAPFIAWLDAALARSSDRAGHSAAPKTASVTPP